MSNRQANNRDKPVVLITGGAGAIGTALTQKLRDHYRIVALDIAKSDEADASYTFDLSSSDSVQLTLETIARECGHHIAAVIHLAAYFDFSGKHSPLYRKVNVEGTRNLLEGLRGFDVERFIYSSTMLVHQPLSPGQRINEDTPIQPQWIYPQSKAETEAVIRDYAGDMPYTLLRLAGLYDETHCVPTLAHQIVRIYEHNLKSHLYAGNTGVGQACIHKEDMIEAFRLTLERRKELPRENVILVGEERCDTYEALQNRLGELIHGKEHWATVSVPKPIAKTGAFVEEKGEAVIPDDFDKGEKPFIRPFMIDLADDHYELDTRLAREQLGWSPQHTLFDTLPKIVEKLKKDPLGWYKANGITPPDWLEEADEHGHNPQRLFAQHQREFRQAHGNTIWAHFINVALGFWLISSPVLLGYADTGLAYSDWGSGMLLIGFAAASLSWKMAWARWVCSLIGLWVLFAPLVFWTENASAYLNGTLVGMLVMGFSAAVRPTPGVSPVAATTGPLYPPGWDNNPSSWLQRLPVIALALVGFFISRYMAAYQLGYIDGVWDPFFSGLEADGKNGTEAITTSEISESFPVADAGLGAIVYALEVLIGLTGSTRRWRTMPWLVASFGVLIVPLGVVSITFIIIQPILIGTWCALCLSMAALMLLQIAYAFNEFVATGEFLLRRHKAGAPVLKVFFTGDTDEGRTDSEREHFERNPLSILRDSVITGVNLPWNLALVIAIGVWLMFTRVTLDNEGALANWDHLVGALMITVAGIALAESARPLRWLIVPLGLILLVTPLAYSAGIAALLAGLFCGVTAIVLSIRRGPIKGRYGRYDAIIR